MFNNEPSYKYQETLSQSEIDDVENRILKTCKRTWTPEDRDLFISWFFDQSGSGLYYASVKELQRSSRIGIKGEDIVVNAMSNESAEDLVQDAIIKFAYIDDQFDPTQGCFETYFRYGLKYLALTKQRRGSRIRIPRTVGNDPKNFFPVIYNYIDDPGDGNLTILQILEADGVMIDTDFLEQIRQSEMKEIVGKLIDCLDLSNQNIQAALMRELDDMKYSDIAKELGKTETNVKTMAFRGLKQMLEIAIKFLKNETEVSINLKEVKK